MLKIGDFSKLTRVSVRMLRYYDSQGLLKPDFVDPESGYRMYSAAQAERLQKIVLLRDLDFGVSQIAELLENWDSALLSRRLSEKIEQTEELIKEERRRIEMMRGAIEHLSGGGLERFYNMTVREVSPCAVVSLRRRVPDYYGEGALWKELYEFVRRERVETERDSRNNIALYHDEEYGETGVDIEVCFIVKKAGKSRDGFVFRTLEGVKEMACMLVYGPYENIAGAYQAFVEWLDDNSTREMCGPTRQIAIIDQRSAADPSEYLTEIQIPLRVKAR